MPVKRKHITEAPNSVPKPLTALEIDVRTSKLRRLLHSATTKDDLVAIIAFANENPTGFDFAKHDANLRPGLIVQRYVECISRVRCTANKFDTLRDGLLHILSQNGVFETLENSNLYLCLMAETKEELVVPSRFRYNGEGYVGDRIGLIQCIFKRPEDEKEIIEIMEATECKSYIDRVSGIIDKSHRRRPATLLAVATDANSALILEYVMCRAFPCSDIPDKLSSITQPLTAWITSETSDAVKDLVWTSERTSADWYVQRQSILTKELVDVLIPELVAIICSYVVRPPLGTIVLPDAS